MARQKIESYDDIMIFGKYKGKAVSWIAEHNPGYIVWLVEEKIVECDKEIYEAAEWDDADNSPPEEWFMSDLGCK